MKHIFILLSALVLVPWQTQATPHQPTTTNPYNIGIPNNDLDPYTTDGQEEHQRVVQKYRQLSRLEKDEFEKFLKNRVLHRTYEKRIDHSINDLNDNVRFESIPHSLLAGAGAAGLHFLRLKLMDKHPRAKHIGSAIGLGGGLLGGLTTSYIHSRIKNYLMKEISNIIAFLQLDDTTLYQLVVNRQRSLQLKEIGLPHPFIDNGKRLHLPRDVSLAIEGLDPQLDDLSPEDGATLLREKIQPLITKRINRLQLLEKTMLPLSVALWTTFGANLWYYPQTHLGAQVARGRFPDVVRRAAARLLPTPEDPSPNPIQ